MTDTRNTLPLYNTPIFDAQGNITEVWWRFFLTLLQRTGGEAGTDLETLTKSLDLLSRQFRAAQADLSSVVAIPQWPITQEPQPVTVQRAPADQAPAPVSVARRTLEEPPERVYNHGQHQDGGLHAAATTTENGFMSATDKAKLDTLGTDSGDWAQVAKASLPTPSASNKGWRRFVTDATGSTGIVPAYCTGTAWKRFSDDSTVN